MAAKRLNITRDCTHNGRHKHGTPVAYLLDKCRCDQCRHAKVHAEQQRLRRIAYGRHVPPFVDAEPVRRHIRALIADGMDLPTIVRQAGVSHIVAHSCIYGRGSGNHRDPSKRMRRENADALLAVRFEQSTHKPVSAVGTHRRLQALVANGWSTFALARELGKSERAVWRWLHHGTVYPATADVVAELYDRLWDQEPRRGNRATNRAITMSKQRARLNGWVPPMAWDEDALDDPDALPYGAEPRPFGPVCGARCSHVTCHAIKGEPTTVDDVKVQRAINDTRHWKDHGLNIAERHELAARLSARGTGWNEVSKRTGLRWDVLRGVGAA